VKKTSTKARDAHQQQELPRQHGGDACAHRCSTLDLQFDREVAARNQAILLMEEILQQLRLVVYPMIYGVFYIPGGAEFVPSTVFHV